MNKGVKRGGMALLVSMLLLIVSSIPVAHTQAAIRPQVSCLSSGLHADAGPIFGIFFCQQVDDVHIVYVNHQGDDVTDEYFGLSYDEAAVQGCVNQGYPPAFLVRYRQDPLLGWDAWCYSDPATYTVIPGPIFGQATIDAAVARAQQIVYPGKSAKKTLSYVERWGE